MRRRRKKRKKRKKTVAKMRAVKSGARKAAQLRDEGRAQRVRGHVHAGVQTRCREDSSSDVPRREPLAPVIKFDWSRSGRGT